jgi:cytoskeletal protein RodZ
MSIADLSRATKIKEGSLELLEEARLDALPARVFVAGFIAAYARAVGADTADVLRRFHAHADNAAEPVTPALPVEPAPGQKPILERVDTSSLNDEDDSGFLALFGFRGERRPQMALVVLVVVIVATLTLSLLLGRGPHRGALSALTGDLQEVVLGGGEHQAIGQLVERDL